MNQLLKDSRNILLVLEEKTAVGSKDQLGIPQRSG